MPHLPTTFVSQSTRRRHLPHRPRNSATLSDLITPLIHTITDLRLLDDPGRLARTVRQVIDLP